MCQLTHLNGWCTWANRKPTSGEGGTGWDVQKWKQQSTLHDAPPAPILVGLWSGQSQLSDKATFAPILVGLW